MSPHRDDAAFSCAIAIRELRKNCAVRVANCFTVSEYAPFRSNNIGTVSECRLREDQAFARVSDVNLQDLHLIDAPQRLSIGVSEISTLRPLDSADAVSVSVITGHILSLNPDVIFLPLAIGNHIDHRIAQAGAIGSGVASLAFYEDLPYSARARTDAPAKRAAELELALVPWECSAPDGREWKRQCASLYSSQIEDCTIAEMADYSDRYGQGERFWVTESAANSFISLQKA